MHLNMHLNTCPTTRLRGGTKGKGQGEPEAPAQGRPGDLSLSLINIDK